MEFAKEGVSLCERKGCECVNWSDKSEHVEIRKYSELSDISVRGGPLQSAS